MSGIRIQCPKCKSKRKVNPRMAGHTIRCPDCDQVITIPELQTTAVAVVDVIDHSERPANPQRTPLPSESLHRSPAAAEFREEELADVPVNLGARNQGDNEMDMTPMVDVTFLLLIFFMITAAFSTEKAIQQKTTPKDATPPPPTEVHDLLTIRIDELNSFLVMLPDKSERDASNKQDLLIALDDAKKEGVLEDVESVVIEAHEESIHSAVVAALDACRSNDFSNFQVKVVEEFE